MADISKHTQQEIEQHVQQIVGRVLIKVNPSFVPDEPEEDETDIAEAYQEKVSELLPGEILKYSIPDIEPGETVYSVKKLRTRWAIYRCQPASQENPLDLTVSRIGSFSLTQAAYRLLVLNDEAELGFELDDILELLGTDTEELSWLVVEENPSFISRFISRLSSFNWVSAYTKDYFHVAIFEKKAFEKLAKKGECLGRRFVDSVCMSWYADWAIQQNTDGTWSLWAVYEPAIPEEADPEPILEGTYPTREEAIASIAERGFYED